MAGLSAAVTIGQNALQVRQRQLTVTGDNIANADRAGFHRRRANVRSSEAINDRGLLLGTGARVEQVVRSYDAALTQNLNSARQEQSYHDTSLTHLQQLEAALAPEGTSPLNDALTSFANSWQDVAMTPESGDNRRLVIERATDVANRFNSTHTNLVALRDTLNGPGAIAGTVTKVNDFTSAIADLNRQITSAEARLFNPAEANTLRDDRDRKLADLNELLGVSVTNNEPAGYTVTIGGLNLVDGENSESLSLDTSSGTPVITDSSGAVISVSGGELGAQIEMSNYLQTQIDELTTFSDLFTTAVNTAHAVGVDQNGDSGTAVFQGTLGVGNGLTVALSDPDTIAAGTGAAPGSGDNARAIWETLNAPVAAINNDSVLNHIDHMVDQIATDTAAAAENKDAAEATFVMFENAVNSYSGVSMDDEMLSMLEIQRAYQSTARFLSVVDEMLASALNII